MQTEQSWQKFRKKPVVIMAFQFKIEDAFHLLVKNEKTTNTGILKINDVPINWTDFCTYGWSGPSDILFQIETLEGPHTLKDKSWIIRGIAGEFYSCREDIFEKTYERVYK